MVFSSSKVSERFLNEHHLLIYQLSNKTFFIISTLFIKIIKIIHKHDRLLRFVKLFKFFRMSNAVKQQWFSHQAKTSAKILKQISHANVISLVKEVESL